ncbi:MAG: hypothetical protein ACD_79C00422G0013 [uncultured bacterium]|nr:MAG: hypothetical protein ACD_79C00422G0013 [uncultured bacterium]
MNFKLYLILTFIFYCFSLYSETPLFHANKFFPFNKYLLGPSSFFTSQSSQKTNAFKEFKQNKETSLKHESDLIKKILKLQTNLRKTAHLDRIKIIVELGQIGFNNAAFSKRIKEILISSYNKQLSWLEKMAIQFALNYCGYDLLRINEWPYNASVTLQNEIRNIVKGINKDLKTGSIVRIHSFDNSLTKGMWMYGSDIDGLRVEYAGHMSSYELKKSKNKLCVSLQNLGAEIKASEIDWIKTAKFRPIQFGIVSSRIIYDALTDDLPSFTPGVISLKNAQRMILFDKLNLNEIDSKEKEVLLKLHAIYALSRIINNENLELPILSYDFNSFVTQLQILDKKNLLKFDSKNAIKLYWILSTIKFIIISPSAENPLGQKEIISPINLSA